MLPAIVGLKELTCLMRTIPVGGITAKGQTDDRAAGRISQNAKTENVKTDTTTAKASLLVLESLECYSILVQFYATAMLNLSSS